MGNSTRQRAMSTGTSGDISARRFPSHRSSRWGHNTAARRPSPESPLTRNGSRSASSCEVSRRAQSSAAGSPAVRTAAPRADGARLCPGPGPVSPARPALNQRTAHTAASEPIPHSRALTRSPVRSHQSVHHTHAHLATHSPSFPPATARSAISRLRSLTPSPHESPSTSTSRPRPRPRPRSCPGARRAQVSSSRKKRLQRSAAVDAGRSASFSCRRSSSGSSSYARRYSRSYSTAR